MRHVGLLLPGLLERRRQPVLRVLDLHHPQPARAGPSATIALACAHHRVGRVVVGQHEHAPGPLDQPAPAPRRPRRSWSAACRRARGCRPSRNARAAGRCRWLGVTIDTTSMPSARSRSRSAISAKRAVGPLRRDARARPPRRFDRSAVLEKHAGDQLVAIVHPGREPVHGADQRTLRRRRPCRAAARAPRRASHGRSPSARADWRPRRWRRRRSRRSCSRSPG